MIDPGRYFQGLGQAHGFNPMDPNSHNDMINNFRGLATHPNTPPGIADQLHYHANSLANLGHVMRNGSMPPNPMKPSIFDQGGISPAGQFTTGDPAGMGSATPAGQMSTPGVQAMPPIGIHGVNPPPTQRLGQLHPNLGNRPDQPIQQTGGMDPGGAFLAPGVQDGPLLGSGPNAPPYPLY